MAVRFPRDPPHKTAEEYVVAMQKDQTYITPIHKCFDTYFRKSEWYAGGLVTCWNSKITSTDLNGQTEEKCLYQRALVRGDGKVLSSIDSCTRDSDYCTNSFATVVDGYLKGVEALGMYEYK